MLQFRLPWQGVALAGAVLIAACVFFFSPHLHSERNESRGGSHFVRPKGTIVFIGLICTISFLVEGSINDWSGVFMTTEKGIDISQSGLGLTYSRLRPSCPA